MLGRHTHTKQTWSEFGAWTGQGEGERLEDDIELVRLPSCAGKNVALVGVCCTPSTQAELDPEKRSGSSRR
jgi:hypothetical protein